MSEEYDPVLDALQKHRDKLWEMTQSNMNCEFLGFNIMDQIRLEHIDTLEEAIRWWKERKARGQEDAK